jgi:two-component system chemotaxis response regulator CheB
VVAGELPRRAPGPSSDEGGDRVVIIGASWGGLNALTLIVSRLSRDFVTPVVVVQHRAKESDGLLADLLQDHTHLTVCEVDDKQPVDPSHVYIAPPDYHLLLDDGYFSLSTEAAVRFSRPSIDVTLISAADAYRDRTVGVVLTGANDDGARGLRHVIDRGGYGIVQHPDTAEVRTMPAAAGRALAGVPAGQWEIAPLDQIADRLSTLLTGAAIRDARDAARRRPR